jgi:hypothetical protein
MRYIFVLQILILFLGCSTTSKQTISESWKGLPTVALDTHSYWVTIPMKRVFTADGTEMRFYIDSGNFTYCSGGRRSYSCLSELVTCNNIFYIKNGFVQKYEPAGSCYTKEVQLPEGNFLRPVNE